MNVTQKAVEVRECRECDNNFMTVGSEKILLSQHRPATRDDYGMPMKGVCPLHRQPRKENDEAQAQNAAIRNDNGTHLDVVWVLAYTSW